MSYEVIEAPKGMRHDLARQLIADPVFAHAWLCHGGDRSKCPDGCDTLGDPDRVYLYQRIRVHTIEE